MQFKNLFKNRNSEKRSLREVGTGLTVSYGTHGNVPLDEFSALNLSAVWRAVNLISSTISTLPLRVYERTENGGRIVARNHPLYKILHDQPNPAMTSVVFREVLQGHIELRGEALAQIIRNKKGEVIELWPIPPGTLKPFLSNGKKYYKYKDVIINGDEILHILGYSRDGIKPVSPIECARSSLQLAKNAQDFGNAFFGNGVTPSLVISSQESFSPEAAKRLKQDLIDFYSGVGNAGKVLPLEGGLKADTLKLSNEDAQFLETRRFETAEIARWFGVPPHLIGDLEKATFSNIEHQSIEAVTYCWRPKVVRWEQALIAQLLSSLEKEKYFVEFDLNGLLRGDMKSRYDAYGIGVRSGFLSPGQIAQIENFPPLPLDIANQLTIGKTYGSRQLLELELEQKKLDLEQKKLDIEVKQKELLEPSSQRSAEIRTKSSIDRESRSLEKRSILSDSYKEKFISVFNDLVKEEITSLREIKEAYENDPSSYLLHIKNDYKSELKKRASESIYKVVTQLAYDLKPQIEEELDQELSDDEYQDFINKYIENFGFRWSIETYGKLKRFEEEKDFDEKFEEQLAYWENNRANVTANEESTRSSNALTRALYVAGGISYLKWRAKDKSCPYCQKLDGKVVGVNEPFASKDDQIGDLKINSNIGHPPLHKGCDCHIVPFYKE